MTDFTLDELCVVACAEAWRDDGEILASPMGIIPTLGARLARATFSPDLVLSDGVASLIAGNVPFGQVASVVEGWVPYRTIFDIVWSGRRHVMMGASQLDPFGNQNFAFIGDPAQPKVQLLGMRGAPGNTVQNITSYWIPVHSPRVFVESIDVVSGIGYDRAAELGEWVREHHELRRVVTNLAVLDFGGLDHRMRLASVHPGVTVAEVVAATGFELVIEGDVPDTRTPTAEELEVMARLDPRGMRNQEVPG